MGFFETFMKSPMWCEIPLVFMVSYIILLIVHLAMQGFHWSSLFNSSMIWLLWAPLGLSIIGGLFLHRSTLQQRMYPRT